MKIYSIQPWIWIWGPSLRKSEAKDKICALLSVPHGWAAHNVLASAGHTAHRAVQSLVPRPFWHSLFSHPVPLGSPGRCGVSSLTGRVSPSYVLVSSHSAESCVPVRIAWAAHQRPMHEFGNFMKYLVTMCLHGGQAKSWKQKNAILAVVGWTGLI